MSQLTSPLFLKSLSGLIPVTEQQETLANLGRLVALGHDVEGTFLGDAKALAVQIVRSLGVISRGDGTDCTMRAVNRQSRSILTIATHCT